jgi:LmbE family N-acetylglucosaminyl deacetylase
MLKFELAKRGDSPLKILCLGAHSDDIEIGCGGTILRLLEECDVEETYWVVFSAREQRAMEAKESANLFLRGVRHKNVVIHSYRDGYFPYSGAEIKDHFEELKTTISPDVIFTHYRHDLHQDHRLISELTWNTFRDHMILEYEIPKYDGDLGTPNFFIHLADETGKKKIEHIMKHFGSQDSRQWFTEDTFLSLLTLRGMESNAPQKYAEAFYCRKVVL